MKNLKKVLALVLAFAMCLTMFASAATYTDVSSDSEYFNAVTLLSDLGIVTGYTDGTYGPDQTITRAEACALVARMLTGKTDVAEYKGASNFTDVSKDYWGESAIGYCVVNNIVVGDGDGKFRPDDAVTQAEFVTMVTRGLGYETASSPLTYPYGYISAAQDNDVLKDVTIVPSEPALRGMDAVIVYNAIFAEYPKMATYKYVNGVYTQDIPTVAEYVYHIVTLGEEIGSIKVGTTTYGLDEDTTFVVTGKSNSVEDVITVEALLTSGNRYTGTINLGSYDCHLTKSQIDAVKYYETKLYYNTDDKEIVAIEVLDSQASYEISSANYKDTATDKNDDGEVLIDGKKFQIQKYALNVLQDDDKKAATMTQVVGSDTWTGLEQILDKTSDGTIYTLYDWNGDRDIDWVDVSTRYYGYVSSYTEGKKISFVLGDRLEDDGTAITRLPNARGDKDLNASIDLTDDAENYAWNIAEGVEEGSIVEIDISREYSTDVKDTFATYTVTPVTALEDVQFTAVSNSDTATDKDGTDGDYYFDGTKYSVADYLIQNTGDDDEENELWTAHQKKLGENYNVYFDRNGYIIYLQAVTAKYDDYMLVLNHNDGAHGSDMTVGSPRVYALIDDDTYKTLTISDDVDTIDQIYHESYGFGVTGVASDVAVAANEDKNQIGHTTANVNTNDGGHDTLITDDQYEGEYASTDSVYFCDQGYDAINGALIGYKLDSNGQISDMDYVGNAGYNYTSGTNRAAETGTAKHAVNAGVVNSYDDDTYKIDINGTKYLLTDSTKVFLYMDGAIGQTGTTADNNSKVVTASELAKFDSGNATYSVYATAITLSGSANASTIEAIALNVNNAYYTAASGTKYPALITGVNQAVVSGSSSKYDFTITAYVQGEKKELKTAQMSNSDFNKNVLTSLTTVSSADGTTAVTQNGFSAPEKLKNCFAWITLNSDGQVTKIQPVYDNETYASNKDVGVTSTRAIVTAKPSGNGGLSYIPFSGDGSTGSGMTGWTASTSANKIKDINTKGKTAASNYAAYDKDVAFYTINVRPNITKNDGSNTTLSGLNNSVKNGPDGSYDVSVATASDILVSTISDNTDSNIYYVADLFFNNDGDIIGVYAYDQDVRQKSTDGDTSAAAAENDLKVDTTVASTGTGKSGDPYTYTLISGYTTCTVREALNLVMSSSVSADVIANDKEKLSGTGNIELGDTLLEADPDPKDPDTNMAYTANANSFKLYVKDSNGEYWTITVKYDYTLEEKANEIVEELNKAGDELSEARAALIKALQDYDTAFKTNYSAAFTASTPVLYAATSLSASQSKALEALQNALTRYNEAVTRYMNAVKAYRAADASYKKANGSSANFLDEATQVTVSDQTTGNVSTVNPTIPTLPASTVTTDAEFIAQDTQGTVEISEVIDSVEEAIETASGNLVSLTVTSGDDTFTATSAEEGKGTLSVPTEEGTTFTVATTPSKGVTVAVTVGEDSLEAVKGVYTVTLGEAAATEDEEAKVVIPNDKTIVITATLDDDDSVVATLTLTATVGDEWKAYLENDLNTATKTYTAAVEKGVTLSDVETYVAAVNSYNDVVDAYADLLSEDSEVDLNKAYQTLSVKSGALTAEAGAKPSKAYTADSFWLADSKIVVKFATSDATTTWLDTLTAGAKAEDLVKVSADKTGVELVVKTGVSYSTDSTTSYKLTADDIKAGKITVQLSDDDAIVTRTFEITLPAAPAANEGAGT